MASPGCSWVRWACATFSDMEGNIDRPVLLLNPPAADDPLEVGIV